MNDNNRSDTARNNRAVCLRHPCAQQQQQQQRPLTAMTTMCPNCVRLQAEIDSLRAERELDQADCRISQRIREATHKRRREAVVNTASQHNLWTEALASFLQELGIEHAHGKSMGLDDGQQAHTLLDIAATALALQFFREAKGRAEQMERQVYRWVRFEASRELDRLYPGNSVSLALRADDPSSLEI
jgi:hypothetical protein